MINSNNLLYIGLSGLAGSGKDTVAKMIACILNFNWTNIEDARNHFHNFYSTAKQRYATFNMPNEGNTPVMCVAFADQLKYVCSKIFGIPVERFYNNKATSWLCINKDFEYTETKPAEEQIVSAEDYYYSQDTYSHSQTRYYMSLREVLVYVGTYLCQKHINKQIFVNVIRNTLREKRFQNDKLSYVILTDVRFNHELDYVHENHGIMIKVTRDSIEQLSNIAEHELDDEERYDYIIYNNKGYDELFDTVWDILHNKENVECQNITINLYTRDNSEVYLRKYEDRENEIVYRFCFQNELQRLTRSAGEIVMIDPVGGPQVIIGEPIPGTDIIPSDIYYDENKDAYFVTVIK